MIFKASLFEVSHSGRLNNSALTVLAWEAEDFGGGGVTWFLGEQKGGSIVTENPKGRSFKTLEGFRGGTNQICLGNEDMGGSQKSSNVIRGDHFSEVTFKGRIG